MVEVKGTFYSTLLYQINQIYDNKNAHQPSRTLTLTSESIFALSDIGQKILCCLALTQRQSSVMGIWSRRILRLWRNLRGYWQIGQGTWHNLRRFRRNRRVYEPTVEIGITCTYCYSCLWTCSHAQYCEFLLDVRILFSFTCNYFRGNSWTTKQCYMYTKTNE